MNKSAAVKTYEAGKLLIKENEISRKMYVIKKGKIKIYKDYLGKKITLAVLGSGEILGELSFFDSAPRSASAEALTEVELVEIDVLNLEQSKELPSWISTVLKSTFSRFREMDREITLLKSMYDFQKKVSSVDALAELIYREVLRFNKTFSLVFHKFEAAGTPFGMKSLSADASDILGKTSIAVGTYLKALESYEFVKEEVKDGVVKIILNTESLDAFTKYLERAFDENKFLLLGHGALNLLKKILELAPTNALDKKNVGILYEEKSFRSVPYFEESFRELEKEAILKKTDQVIVMTVSNVGEFYHYQSILKTFDHDITHLT